MFPDFNKLKEQIRKDSQINDPLWGMQKSFNKKLYGL